MEKRKLHLITCLITSFICSTYPETLEGQQQKVFNSPDCRTIDAKPIGMRSGDIPDEYITASTSENKRPPQDARVGDNPGSWTAAEANRYQYLQVNLGERKLITAVSTQGRKGSNEFITEYRLAFSDDGNTWRYYTNEFSMPEVFMGNTESYKEKMNQLRYPIVTKYLQFNPVRWMTRISMRVEVFGCPYKADTASFADGYIYFDVSHPDMSIQREDDTISLRFRTDQPDGVILYADSNQGDYIILELRRGYLSLHINLGSTEEASGHTSVTGGSLLDDGQWHDVIVLRKRKDVVMVVDRLETKVKTRGDFFRLDLDKKIYIGGLAQFKMQGLVVQPRSNFLGCLENVDFNGAKMIRDASNQVSRYFVSGVGFKCRMTPVPPLTFHSTTSKLILKNRGATSPVRVSLQFRTHNTDSYLVHTFLTKTLSKDAGDDNVEYARMEVQINTAGFIYYMVRTEDGVIIDNVHRNIDPESKTGGFNDGLWHKLLIIVRENSVECTVDGNLKKSERPVKFTPTSVYTIGGYKTGISFMGCMREIEIGGEPILIKDLNDGNADVQQINLGTCSISDRCIPNPCEHGGICRQDWSTFSCICDNTGYTGVTCRISLYPLSCFHFKMYSGSKKPEKTIIDIDGSGPLPPFSVLCNVVGTSLQTTQVSIGHDSMEEIKVFGYACPGSYKHHVKYEAEYDSLVEVVNRAYECQQLITYKCNNSRLLAQPTQGQCEETQQDLLVALKTYGWWVGRSQQPMHFWGGAAFGTRSCACGLTEQGCRGGSVDTERRMCNCDVNMEGISVDSGYLREKDHLPVMSMYFGDTDTPQTINLNRPKIGWHTLDKLECTGDNLFDNVITFRKLDATIEVGTFSARSAGDIWFQFRTTQQNAVIMHNTAVMTDDFVQISLLDGGTIIFSYNSGCGTKNIQSKSAAGLNDNNWHTVHIERNRKQASLKVDEQSPDVFSEEVSDGYRTMDLSGPLVIGAKVDNRDGYVGCMRGLMVNGILVNLRAIVEKNDLYGVSVGCNGKCDSNPCFNGGTCIEEYKGYKCDCSYTPYRGWMCGRQVGANINRGDFIEYNFDQRPGGISGAAGSRVDIGFSTKLSQGILLQIQNDEVKAGKREYISIELDNNGGVKIVLDVGFGREEINTPSEGIEYTNGQQHMLKVRRSDNGKIIQLQVDNYGVGVGRFSYLPASVDALLNNPKVMYIGNNDSTTNIKGFEGCIYGMQFDNIYPLKDAFQEPRNYDFVRFYSMTRGARAKQSEDTTPEFRADRVQSRAEETIKEDMCGYEEVTQPPDPVEVRKGGGILTRMTLPTSAGDDGWTIGQKIGLGIGGAIILLFLLIIVFYFLFRGGVYRTQEARGADFADNPDAALMYNQVGQPELSNVQEWFM